MNVTVKRLLVLICVIGAAVAYWRDVEARQKPEWVCEPCMINNCVAQVLNRLTPERAAEAKLTTWGNTTYVWYRSR